MWRLLLLMLCFVPSVALAYVPHFVHPQTVRDYLTVPTDAHLYSYYGVLNNFPQTYTVTVAASSSLMVQILVPDLATVANDRAGIIVRRERRGVSEVARLEPAQAHWTLRVDPETGDQYRVGGAYRGQIKPGTYHIEVSTGANLGPYVVQIGVASSSRERLTPVPRGYFGKLHDIYAIKRFFGEPWYMVLAAPDYFWPLVGLLVLMGSGWYYRHRRNV